MAGPFYLAWVQANETTFDPSHIREDEDVFSFDMTQEEGDFCNLKVEIINPRVGLLSPSRNVWAWLSWDRNFPGTPDVVPLFFGRLVGIPTDFFEDIITLEFIARPANYAALKEALADTLRALPHYDPAFVDEQRRADPDVVLEARPQLWHIDRVTHALSASHILVGEDGVETFDEGDIFHGTLAMNLNNVPLTKIKVDALLSWTQRVGGTVDLTDYIVARFPSISTGYRTIRTQYNGIVNSWPKTDARLGDGWIATIGFATALSTLTVESKSSGASTTTKFGDGSGARYNYNSSYSILKNERGWPIFPVNPTMNVIFPNTLPPEIADFRVGYPQYLLSRRFSDTPEDDEPPGPNTQSSQSRDDEGRLQGHSTSTSWSEDQVWTIPYAVRLVVGVDPNTQRRQNERITFEIEADVQPLVTLPDEEDAERIEINSVDLAEEIDGTAPLPFAWARNYISSTRGQQSLQYLILLARARLLLAARAVELSASVPFERIVDVSLRKSAWFLDPRLPGGAAQGKIIRYSARLNGDDGTPELEVTIGCAIGRNGEIVALAGEPTYAEAAYVGNDYQEFTNKRVVIDTGLSDIGYIVPLENPQDDGLNFGVGLSVFSIIKTPLAVVSMEPPTVRFSLKPVSGDFESPYAIDVTQLKIPRMIDLEFEGS